MQNCMTFLLHQYRPLGHLKLLGFFICEHGERMTNDFDMFGEELKRRDWHTLPIQMKRMYLIFLTDRCSIEITLWLNNLALS